MIKESTAEEFHGNVLTFKCPSGFEVTIREQTGEDDDVISKMKNAKDGSSINKFIAGIIVENTLYPENKKLTSSQVEKLRLNDKYYILLKSRLHSLGAELNFKHACASKQCGKETEFEEDLALYDWDLNTAVPDKDSNDFFEARIRLYPESDDEYRILELKSGKIVRYKHLDGIGEKKASNLNPDEITINEELKARSIQMLKKGADQNSAEGWQKLQRFDPFTAREMGEIRRHVRKYDWQFTIDSEVICGHCSNKEILSLATLADFFFPSDI